MSKYILQCCNCNKTYESREIEYLCPVCELENSNNLPPKGVLKTIYNYDKIIFKYGKNLFSKLKENHFIDLLPIENIGNMPNLAIGNTPLLKIQKFSPIHHNFEIFIKNDTVNPTFSFKDRASALVSAYAKEQNKHTIVAASTGNAGSSIAGICAANGQKAVVFVPEKAPIAKLTQIIMYGAQIVPVAGNYDLAFDLSIEATKKFGWYNRNTAYNPFTIEGKKTVAFEIYEQLNFQSPDNVFVSVGDGVILSGIYKGFEDLKNLGLIEKIPTIFAVQAENSSNFAKNILSENFVYSESNTIADSISVNIPRNFYMAKNYLTKYAGETILVSDYEILTASKFLSINTGLFAEPAASAAYSGLYKAFLENKIMPQTKNVVLLTGSGLKDLQAVQKIIEMPASIHRIEELNKNI